MLRKTIHLYPTLRCNTKCSYCSNIIPAAQQGVYAYQEKSPGHWIKLLGQLNEQDIYITGGEIFLFNGVTDILENIPNWAIIYTNGMMITEKLLGNTDPNRVKFRCSYHFCSGPIERFVESIELLKSKDILFQIFMVDVVEENALKLRAEYFRGKGFELGIDYDQRRHVHKKGTVKCSLHTAIVSPEGTVFHCVSKMIRHKDPGNNLFEGGEIADLKPVMCDEPGNCSPCDLAASYQKVIE